MDTTQSTNRASVYTAANRLDQLADGSWRIMPKSARTSKDPLVPNSKEPLVLSAVGSSFATLSKFDPKSDKQRWLFKTP
jgi:hypothetical protein